VSFTTILALPVALGVLWTAGLGGADVLARRLPRDARAALAPLVAAAALFVTSPIALAGVPPLVLAIIVLGSLTAITVVRRQRVLSVARKATWPAAVACLALVLSAAPAIRNGTWAAATLGNQDPYVWVSQARALTDGPARGAAATTPDRVEYNRLTQEKWPTGVAVSLAELAAAEGVDPVHAYGVFAALAAALLAIAVFFCARGCLHWSARRAAFAAGLTATNGLVLMSVIYGWQAQFLLTAMGTLMILTLPVCLDRRAPRREVILPALFAAAAIGVYGWLVAPFVAVAFVACAACWPVCRKSLAGRKRFVGRVGSVVALAFVLGLVPIVEAAWLVTRGQASASPAVLRSWARYDWAFPSDSLGLVPRSPWDGPGHAWTIVALAVGSLLLATGALRARSFRNPRGGVLVASSATVLALLAALAVTGASPYTSFKLMAYSTPLLTLLALGAYVPRRSAQNKIQRAGYARQTVSALASAAALTAGVVAALLFTINAATMMWVGLRGLKVATSVDGAVAAARKLPQDSVIRIDDTNAWNQVWLVYFLRDRRLSLRQPGVAFAGYAAVDAAKGRKFDEPASYGIGPSAAGPLIWRGQGAAIYSLPKKASRRTPATGFANSRMIAAWPRPRP
jgi:hypothetical protein